MAEYVGLNRPVIVSAKDFCAKAAEIVAGPREKQHGKKLPSFTAIARLWSAYLGVEISAVDVANLMVAFKMTRTRFGDYNPDDFIDMIGYAACGGEIAEEIHSQTNTTRNIPHPSTNA